MSSKEEMRARDYLMDLVYRAKNDGGIKLPSENEMALRFSISRHSVRKIYDELEKMGLVLSKQGVGRFVYKDLPVISLAMTGESFTSKMLKQGLSLETINLGVREVSKAHMEKALGGRVYEISRLRILQGFAAAVHKSYISDRLFPQIGDEGGAIGSIADYYRDKGIADYSYSKARLSIKYPDMEMMETLACKSLVPLLVLEGQAFDKDGRPIEYIESYYRSDLFKYELSGG